MKNVVVLGSTGSIGRNALRVIKQLDCKVFGLVANTNHKLLLSQIKAFRPAYACLIDQSAYAAAARPLKTDVLCGLAGVKQLVTDRRADIVISALSGGSVGLPSTLWAIDAGKTIALANKESLVMAGHILMARATRTGARIIPVDSEHSAVWQLIRSAGLPTGHGHYRQIKHIILTASGGPFYKYPAGRLRHVTLSQALNHPTWRMGAKITVDSATMMNKALEIIEAHHLFGLPAGQIKVLIHPQSIVHGLVELSDGTTLAHLSQPDMRLPIRYALDYALDGAAAKSRGLRLRGVGGIGALTFEEPSGCAPMFRTALELGYEVIRQGGTSGAVLNAANEEAVRLFLKRRIPFTDIVKLTAKVFNKHKIIKKPGIADILASDSWARNEVRTKL
jgi:1-deoxy-D-xylulose-5-phosphate reductoisomerase